MKAIALSLLATLALSSAAYADEPAGPHNGPCRADVEKLCPGVKPGGGRIIQCLKAHKDEVSDACKADLKQMKARRGGGDAGGSGDTDADAPK